MATNLCEHGIEIPSDWQKKKLEFFLLTIKVQSESGLSTKQIEELSRIRIMINDLIHPCFTCYTNY